TQRPLRDLDPDAWLRSRGSGVYRTREPSPRERSPSGRAHQPGGMLMSPLTSNQFATLVAEDLKPPVVSTGMHTPWGQAQYAIVMLPGIGFVGTASHGGIKVDQALMESRMPDYLQRVGGWFEEDCEWAIVFAVFEAE